MEKMFWVTQLNVFSNTSFMSETPFDITVYQSIGVIVILKKVPIIMGQRKFVPREEIASWGDW